MQAILEGASLPARIGVASKLAPTSGHRLQAGSYKGGIRAIWEGAGGARDSLCRNFAVLAELAVARVAEIEKFVGIQAHKIVQVLLQGGF